MPTPLHQLARELLRYSSATTDMPPKLVTVEFRYGDDQPLGLTFPERMLREMADAAEDSLCPAELAIIEVVNSLEVGETLSGEEVALRAGYRYGGWFSQRIKKLAKLGTLCCHGRRGYGRNPP